MARLVLLDRDGVLNVDRADYVKHPGELVLLPGAAAAVARLNRAGYAVAVCTNQSPIGRGIFDEAMLARIHEALREGLAREGAKLDAIFHCPDAPGPHSTRRKPAPGMLIEALAMFAADAPATPFVGDSLRDLQAAAAIGCPPWRQACPTSCFPLPSTKISARQLPRCWADATWRHSCVWVRRRRCSACSI